MDVLERIDKLRVEKGWSMYKLAEESNLPSSTIINMFSRKSLPSIQTLFSICEGLGISVSKFFVNNREDEINSKEKDFINKFNLLSDKEKDAVICLIEKLIKKA